MTRLSHLTLGLSMALAAACDLPDKSIGDEGGDDGNAMDAGSQDDGMDDGGGSDAGDAGDAGDDEGACTLIGCDDMLSISIAHEGLSAGTWTVAIDAPAEGGGEECSFESDGAGDLSNATCNALFLPGEVLLQLPDLWTQVTVTVSLEGIERGSTTTEVQYEDVAPNGPECGPVCTQGTVSLSVSDAPVIMCDDIEGAYASAFTSAQACTDAAECGQTIAWGSCGCTRAPVVRLDADIMPLENLWSQGVDLECPFTQAGGTCDCPEADGFACIDGACTWNYL